MGDVKLGDHVEVTGKDLRGQISFIGTTDFAAGKWIGKCTPPPPTATYSTIFGHKMTTLCPNMVIFYIFSGVTLPEAKGKNDGSVQGKSYFKCNANCGIFVRQNQVHRGPGWRVRLGLIFHPRLNHINFLLYQFLILSTSDISNSGT